MRKNIGEKIPLTLQLFDGATDKYARAIIRNSAGVALDESPVDLNHVGDGLYVDTAITITMPASIFITITYITYDDAEYTTPSSIHDRTLDLIHLFHDTHKSLKGEIK